MESTTVDDGLHHLLFSDGLNTRPRIVIAILAFLKSFADLFEFIFNVLQQFLKGKIFIQNNDQTVLIAFDNHGMDVHFSLASCFCLILATALCYILDRISCGTVDNGIFILQIEIIAHDVFCHQSCVSGGVTVSDTDCH